MYLNRSGEKVYSLPVLEDYVEIKGEECVVAPHFVVYVCTEDDNLILGKETFYKYPSEQELKWCLYKHGVATGHDAFFAKVSKQYGLTL